MYNIPPLIISVHLTLTWPIFIGTEVTILITMFASLAFTCLSTKMDSINQFMSGVGLNPHNSWTHLLENDDDEFNTITTKNNELFYSHFEQIFAVLLRSSNTLKMRKKILKLSFLKIILSIIFSF